MSPDAKEIIIISKKFYDPSNNLNESECEHETKDQMANSEYDYVRGPIIDYKDQFQWKKSSASFKVEDVHGIIFGGFSSRFWALRK